MRIKRVRRLNLMRKSLSDVVDDESDNPKCSPLKDPFSAGGGKENSSEMLEKRTVEPEVCRNSTENDDKKTKKERTFAGMGAAKKDISNITRRKSFNDVDSRKVEPLRLSLNRDAMKNLPQETDDICQANLKIKLTTKNETSGRSSYENVKTPETHEKSFPEARVIPKLTIRAGDIKSKTENYDSKHSVVPKLTIRMENPNLDCSLSTDSNAAPSPLPKLRIKTNGEILQSSFEENNEQPENSFTIPKLTIKASPVPGPSNDAQAVPKLTIRTITYKPGFWSPSSSSEDERIYENRCLQNLYASRNAEETQNETMSGDKCGQNFDDDVSSQDSTGISSNTANDGTLFVPKITISMNNVCPVTSTVSSPLPDSTNETSLEHSPRRITKQRSREDTENSRKVIILQESHTPNRIPKLMIKQIATGTCLVNEVCHKSPARVMLEKSDFPNQTEPKLPTDATLPLEEANSQSKQSKILLQSIENVDTMKRVPKIRIKTAPNVIFGKRIPRVLKSRHPRDRFNLNVVRKGKIPIILLKRLRRDLMCPAMYNKVPKLKIRSVKNKFKSGFVLVNSKTNQNQCNINQNEALTLMFSSPRYENFTETSRDGFTSPAVSLAARSTLMSSSEDETDTRSEMSQIATLQTEAHVLPKLTIRANDTNPDITHTVVPKLTIKMESSNKQDRRYAESPVSDAANPVCKPCVVSIPKLPPDDPPPEENENQTTSVPKLTIKTIPGKFSVSNCKDGVQIACDASSNQKYIMTDCGENTIPRITIKTLPDSKDQVNQIVPKLVIRKKKKKSSSSKAKKSSKTDAKFTVKPKSNDKHQAIPKLRISKRGNNKVSSICTRSCQKVGRIPKIKITQRKVRFDNVKYIIGKNNCIKKQPC